MSSAKMTFGLQGNMTGQSDPIDIKIVDFLLKFKQPSLTSGVKSTSTGSVDEILGTSAIPGLGGYKHYVYLRNIGANGDLTTGGFLKVQDGSGNDIMHLKVGDIAFFPLIQQAGLKVLFDNSDTNYVYAYFAKL